MTVKKYTAESMKAAMERVKSDIGDDALIINTRRIPRSARDPYGRDLFEIEAAPSEEKRVGRGSRGVADTPAVDKMIKGIVNRMKNDKTGRKYVPDSGSAGWKALQEELGSIKELLWCSGQNDSMGELLQEKPEIFRVYSVLIRSGISEKRVQGFMTRGIRTNEKGTTDDVTKSVLKEVVASLKTKDPFISDASFSGHQTVSAFIGPTGAGKTTTIAKLAADLRLKRKKKVGLISVDNYRIGAVDQLKTYSAIIGLPFIPAFSGNDLKKAVKKLSGVDHILVDTSGQSPFDNKRMSELKDIIDHVPGATTHLVMSMTTGRLDMKESVNQFGRLSPSTYVFSKVDETQRCGTIIDQVMDHALPVSFITNGQEVPEDFMVATQKNVLQLLIN